MSKLTRKVKISTHRYFKKFMSGRLPDPVMVIILLLSVVGIAYVASIALGMF